jgi:Zn-dependent membrane protease YugP
MMVLTGLLVAGYVAFALVTRPVEVGAIRDAVQWLETMGLAQR